MDGLTNMGQRDEAREWTVQEVRLKLYHAHPHTVHRHTHLFILFRGWWSGKEQ